MTSTRQTTAPEFAAVAYAALAAGHEIGGYWSQQDTDAVAKGRPGWEGHVARRTGYAGWIARDPGAGPLLDQAWHRGWIAVAAVIVAGSAGR